MKFDVKDKVTTVTGRVGEVVHCKNDRYIVKGKLLDVWSYGVIFAPFFSINWFNESDLRHLDKFEAGFEREFELTFLNLMIDKYLDKRSFDIVKYYADFKNEILKCGGSENDL